MKLKKYRYSRTEQLEGQGPACLDIETDEGEARISAEDCRLFTYGHGWVHVGEDLLPGDKGKFTFVDDDLELHELLGFTNDEQIVRIANDWFNLINSDLEYQETDWIEMPSEVLAAE